MVALGELHTYETHFSQKSDSPLIDSLLSDQNSLEASKGFECNHDKTKKIEKENNACFWVLTVFVAVNKRL